MDAAMIPVAVGTAVAMSQPVPSGEIAALLAVLTGGVILIGISALLAVIISVLKH